MFSKALFKQSIKANKVMWLIITFATCFMLATVMLISGGGNITEVADSITDTVIVGEINSQIENASMSYYYIADNAIATYDAYGQVGLDSYIAQVDEQIGEGAEEVNAMINIVMNLNSQYNEVYGVTLPTYTGANATKDTDARQQYSRKSVSNFLAMNMSSDEYINKMVSELSTYGVTLEKYNSFEYNYAKLDNMAETEIVAFQSQLDYENEQLVEAGLTGVELQTASQNAAKELTESLSASLLDTLPSDVASALEEIGGMDMYSLIVGSIFYKIAGLLLPIIYLIMVSNSLIAGQVDSGSMAYVLSSSTKRKQVTFTQAVFLVGSLLAMFTCTTITSLICLSMVKTTSIALTYNNLLFINLGAFLTMFAMSGICFLASCWFNRSKNSMAIGGGLTMFFLVATMLGLFGSPVLPSIVRLSALNSFNYLSLITLFDVISILDGSLTFLWKFAILLVVGIICYIIGSEKFKTKDLSL